MNRSRRGSNSNSHSCGEENEVENVVGDSRRSKKSASAEPFAISSNDSATGSTGSIDRGKKKKFSFWSNLFKSKISEKDENEVIGLSSSYESVNSAASTNSFAFVSPKKYKGKGGHKGKRIPVDEQTLPRTAKERDGSLPRGRSRNGGAGGGNKMGTLSRIGMKMGLKKKYNLQSCESLEHIVTTAPVVQPFSRGSKSSAVVEKGQWRLPPLNKSSSSKQSGSNGTDLPKLDPLVNDHNVLPPVEKASSSKQSETSATELPSEISDLSKSDPVEKYQSGLSVEKASSSKQAFSNGNRLSLKVPEINKSPEKVIGLPPKSEEPFPSTSQSQANKVEEGNKVPAEIPIPVTDSSPLQMSSEYDSGTWTNSRGKRRAPAPPNNLKGSTRNNNVIEIPGNKSSKEAEEGNVELKSVTRVGERNEMEKRESYPSGALRRNKSSSRDKFPSRPCSCSSSIFAHHSKYQPRKYGHCSSENCCNNNSNYNSKTRTHVKGKKKAPPPPNPFGDPDAPEELELPQIKNIPQSKNEITYGNANCTKVSSQIQSEPSKEINKTSIESKENSKKVSKTQSQPEPCKEVIKNQNVPKSSSEETKASSAAQKGSENSSDLSEGSKTKPVEFREFAHLSCSKTATVEAQPASEEISPKNSKIHPTGRLSMGNGESEHVVAAGPSRENHENRNEEARSLQRQAITLETQPSTENGTSTSSAIVLEESQDEAAQNALNDRQEKEQQLLTSNEVTVQPSSPTSVTLSSDVEVTPAVAGPSTSSTTKATGSTKNRLFNFSSKRNSRESEKMTEKDLQDAENELQALLHSSGTLKAEAKKVDEQVKAQLVELKKESDKSPLMFFGSKSKKSSSTTGNSSKEIPGTSASSSPIPSCSSPEPEQRVTPRPWYKRSISISSSSKSPTGSKPKIPPKPTIKMQMLPKFSELDREAQKIVEENRRKSAEIAFNENARELINMFNTTFSPTAEDISAESENQENSSRNLQSQSLPTSSSDAGDNNVTPSSSCSMQSPATKTSISASSKPVTTNLQSDEQKNVAVVQPQSKQIQIQAKSQPSSLVAPITLASTNAPNSWTIAPITSVNTPIAKISTNSSSSAITPTTLTTTPITKASTSTLTPVLSATVVPSVRGSTAVTTVSSSVTSNRNVTSVATPVPKISSAAAVPASSTTTTMITLQGSSAISLSTNPGTTTTTNSTSVTSPPSTKSPEPEWSCSRCTLKNSPWRALCEACYCRKDSPSLANPITSIFERVNANKSNTSTSASGNIINSKPVYVSAGSNGSASSTTEISKKPMQLVRPKSSASPACENFLSQLPSKEALGKEEKLQGMKLNAIEDPEVEELDIEKLRKARLAFFDKEQKSKVKKSLDKPNNLAVCSSSSGSSGKDFTRLKANVFSDGEDDSIDSLLQLNTNNSVNGNSSKRSETSSKNNNNNASASSPPGVVEPVSASVTAAKVQQPKPQGTVTVPVVAGQFRFRPMLESIFESDSNYYSTGEFERTYENWQLKEQMQNSLDENDDETISEGPTSTFMQFPLSVDSMQRRLQGRNKMEQNMQTTNQVHVAENANMNVMRVDLPSASFSNFRSFNNPVVYPAQSSSYPVVYTNPVVGSANANGSYPHQQHRVYSPIESDANYFYLKDNNNSGSSSDAEGQNMEREGRRTRGQRNSIGQREQRQLSYEDYRKLGAVPKGYFNDFPDERSVVSSGSDSGRQDYFSDREQSRRRSSNGNGSRRRQSRGDDEARYFNEPSAESFSSEYNTMAVGKLLRRLEMAIGMGEHRLAATLAHDLALLKVNCVVAKPNKEPITIRVYVEDRFMQQGPFQVQVLQTMTLRELKLKVEGDWGIPCGFQKWILGKKMAEDDCETLNFYEVVNDTMAFLYLVTPQIEKKSNSPRPKPKEPSPPPIPSKPSNNVNMMAIGLQSHSTSIQNDTRKNAASPKQINATKKSSDDDTNNANNKNSADEPVVSLYRKPLPPASATDFNNVQKKTPESTETMPIPTPMPIPRVRTASTSRDTPERNVSSTVNSNQQQLPLLRMTKDHSSSPKPENKPQEVSNSQKSSQNLSSNSQLSQNIDTESVSKLKAKSPTHSNIINNNINNPTAGGNNFPISLQQKLANLREAAEQAFGKSFGQTSGNSEQKQNIPTKSSPEIKIKSKSASENVVKNSVRVGPDSSSVIRHNAAVNKEIQSQNQSTRKAGHESIKTQVEIKENAGISKNIPAIKLSNADVPITKNFSKDTKNEATLANSNAEIQAKTNKIFNSVETEKSEQSSKNPTPAIQANANNNILSEIPSISSVEVNVSEPRPKPRARKQNLSESSGDSLKNEKVTLGNVKEESPTNITSTVDKFEVIITKSTDVQKVPTTGKVKSDGSCQTTLAFPLPKSPVVVRNVSEEKPVCNSQNVTVSPGNKSPSSNQRLVLKSPSPTTSLQNGPNLSKGASISPQVNGLKSPSPVHNLITEASTTSVKSPSVKSSENASDLSPKKSPFSPKNGPDLAKVTLPALQNQNELKPMSPVLNNIAEASALSSPVKSPENVAVSTTDLPPKKLTASPIKALNLPSSPTISQIPVDNESEKKLIVNSSKPPVVPIVAQLPLQTGNKPLLPVSSNPMAQVKSVTPPSRGPLVNNLKNKLGMQQQSDVYKTPCFLNSNSSPRPFKSTTEASGGITGVVFQGPSSQLKSAPVLSISCSPPVQNGMTTLQRKNSDSSIINVDFNVSNAENTSSIEGAAALPDDKKEDNIQTYLSMLQLMEKQDLIMTSEAIECPVCFLLVPPGEGVTLRDCLHNFCKECLIGAVQYAEDSEVKCPFRDTDYSCNSSLQEREIKALVPGEIFEKYLANSVKLAERKMMNTFHCKTNDCTGWCVFEDDVNSFNCPVCKKRNCLTCAAIHENMDCQQYQRELAIASETDENAKSSRLMLEKMIQRGEALECPACHVVLLKKWGCDWVRCSYCKTEICWVTKGFRWGPGGKGDMSGGCKCGVNGVRCHPRCTYCH